MLRRLLRSASPKGRAEHENSFGEGGLIRTYISSWSSRKEPKGRSVLSGQTGPLLRLASDPGTTACLRICNVSRISAITVLGSVEGAFRGSHRRTVLSGAYIVGALLSNEPYVKTLSIRADQYRTPLRFHGLHWISVYFVGVTSSIDAAQRGFVRRNVFLIRVSVYYAYDRISEGTRRRDHICIAQAQFAGVMCTMVDHSRDIGTPCPPSPTRRYRIRIPALKRSAAFVTRRAPISRKGPLDDASRHGQRTSRSTQVLKYSRPTF